MKSNIFLFISILTILTSCNGQTASHTVHKQTISSQGDTVSELSNSIFIIFQATNGAYWFGSDKHGLYKVDGKIITHFTTKDGLSSNRIRSIQEDKEGNLYIGTLGGISKFDGQTFTTLKAIKENNWRLHPDDLWFSMVGKIGDKGPYRYDGKNLYQLEFPKHYMEDAYFERFPNNAWSPYEVYSIYKDSTGNIWFGTANFGVCRYDGVSLSWLYEDHLTNTPIGGSFGIRSIIEDIKGGFWICNTKYRYTISEDSIKENNKVLIKYERKEGIEGIISTSGNDAVYFMSAINDNKGNLWFATYSQGVWCYDGESAKQYIVKDGDKNTTLYSIYKDNKGEIWLGTHEAGTYKFNGESFEKFTL